MHLYIRNKSIVLEFVYVLCVELRLRLGLLDNDLTLFNDSFLRQRKIFGDLKLISDLDLVYKTFNIAKLASKFFDIPGRMKTGRRTEELFEAVELFPPLSVKRSV